jgi:deoxyadenosine/deoxycytidine kinase
MKTITVTISGEQGLGKTTLARILMNALGGRVVTESAEEVLFEHMDPEELELWGERLFADTKIVFKTEQTQTEPIR